MRASPGLAPLFVADDGHPALRIAARIKTEADAMLARANTPGYQGMMYARRMMIFGLVAIDVNLDDPRTFEVSTWMATNV